MKFSVKIAGVFAVVAFALTAVSANAAFTRSLTLGSTGADVIELQDWLVSKGFLTIPAGVSKGYFGAMTQSALAKYQASVGIVPAAGYFGPITMAKIAGAPAGNGNGNVSGDLKGGDGDFKSFKLLGTPSSEDVYEGDSTKVIGFEFTAKDSDLEIDRMELLASSTNANVTKPWKVLDTITVYNGSESIAEVDASDSDNWDEVGSTNTYTIKLSGLNSVVEENDKAKLYVEVTAKDSLDSTDLGSWEIGLTYEGLRAVNAEGVNVYEGDDSDVKTFTLKEAKDGDLTITVNSNDNKDRTVGVDKDNDTNDEVTYVAAVKSKTGTNNVETATVGFSSPSGEALSDMIGTVYLFIDGDEVGSESVASSVVFDDINYDLDEGDTVDFEVRVDLNDTNDGVRYQNNDSFKVTDMTIDYVDSNDNDKQEIDTTDGGVISLATETISVEFVKGTIANVASAPTSGTGSAVEEYSIVFDVTALGDEDMYVTYVGTTTDYAVVSSGGTVVEESTSMDAEGSDSADSATGNYFIVRSGETRTFTFTATLSATGTSASTRMVMSSIGYGLTTSATSTYTQNISDFKTGTKTIIVR